MDRLRMSADNAYFLYLDRGGYWRVRHGFASHVPDLTADEMEEFFAEAWGSRDEDEAFEYARRCANDEYICEYGVWQLNGFEDGYRDVV